jgi:hypothetical protein
MKNGQVLIDFLKFFLEDKEQEPEQLLIPGVFNPETNEWVPLEVDEDDEDNDEEENGHQPNPNLIKVFFSIDVTSGQIGSGYEIANFEPTEENFKARVTKLAQLLALIHSTELSQLSRKILEDLAASESGSAGFAKEVLEQWAFMAKDKQHGPVVKARDVFGLHSSREALQTEDMDE